MYRTKNLILVIVVLLCATAVIAQDFMPPPNPRGGGAKEPTVKSKKTPEIKAYLEADLMDALEMGCDQLIRWQHTDGGWIWPGSVGDEFKTTDTATSPNQKGVVARALVLIDSKFPAKDYLGDGSYPGACFTGKKIQEQAISLSTYFYAPDYTFMCELTDETGDPDYKTSATQVWTYKKTYNAVYSTPFSFSDYFMKNRCAPDWVWNNGYGYGLCVWDVAGYAGAAEKMGDHAFAVGLLDNWTSEHDWTNPPPQAWAHWNDTANGYNKNVMHNFLKRWDDNTATSTTQEREYFFIGAAGNMMWAMNIVDSSAYSYWINEMKTRLINDCQTSSNAYKYEKFSDPDVCVQDQGYAMMGMRNVGEQESGRKSTEWAINNQETTGNYKGMWIEPWGLSYQEGNSECLQGMWDIHEGDVRPWVQITAHPLGNHVDSVPVSFKVFDLQSDSATIKVEWTDDAGGNWYPATLVNGSTSGLSTTPSGIEHSIVWMSASGNDIPWGTPNGKACELRIFARDDASPGEWGSPAGKTNTFTVDNATVPVELSIFNIE